MFNQIDLNISLPDYILASNNHPINLITEERLNRSMEIYKSQKQDSECRQLKDQQMIGGSKKKKTIRRRRSKVRNSSKGR